jgi:DNA primase
MISFKDLKSKITMLDVLNHYHLFDTLELRGKSHRGVCLWCENTDPYRLSVNLDRNCFQCFSCKASGNIFDFVALMEGIDVSKGIRPAAEFIEKVFLQKKESKTPTEPCLSLPNEKTTNTPLSFELKGIDPSHQHVLDLGISENTARKFGAGFFSGKGMFKNHVVIPIFNPDQQLIAYTGIPIKGKPKHLYPPQFTKERELFHPPASYPEEDENGLIIVRDPLHVLVLAEAGYHNTLAFMSNTLAKEQVKLLLRMYGTRKKITLLSALGDVNVLETLNMLLVLFYARLVRFEPQEDIPGRLSAVDIQKLLEI